MKRNGKWMSGLDNHNTERQRFYQFLQTNISTCSMVSELLRIPQKNLCRYKRYYEKRGLLWEIYYLPCPITGYMAWHITTNPSLLTKQPALNYE